jgi:hypothetical protein
MAGTAEEAQRRGPPRRRPFRRIGTGSRREVLAEHGGPQLGSRRLTERMVLRYREQRRYLHLGDVVMHARNRRWGVLPMRPPPVGCIISDMNENNDPASDPKIDAAKAA